MHGRATAMKLVIFGLSISSSWGNGHATLWRGLIGALTRAGHEVTFFERDVPYYARNRDLRVLEGNGHLVLYPAWEGVRAMARVRVAEADAALVTSYCPDAVDATDLILGASRSLKVFYDLDAPVTLEQLRLGRNVPYLGPHGLSDFDLVLSYTGGAALDELRTRLGARRVAPLFGSVDPALHRPVTVRETYSSSLSYLGTYAADRQDALNRLLLEPARRSGMRRFIVGGPLYPTDLDWPRNVRYVPHVAPLDHPAFYCSSSLTLNITRAAMARLGYCPSGRLFEAAACGVPVVTDDWEGLDRFLAPGREVFVVHSVDDVLEVLSLPPGALAEVGWAARERTLDEHTAECRARELVRILEGTGSPWQLPEQPRPGAS